LRLGRALAFICSLALLCLGPIDAAPAHANLPSVGACQADAVLKVGDSGASVICLQFALGMLHLSNQPITGVFDETTAAAVTWFQASNPPLRVDGRAGPLTLQALGVWSGKTTGVGAAGQGVVVAPCRADATIGPGERSASVSCLQDTLRELGLFSGADTGVSDAQTVDALKQYQRERPPLQIDGWAGPRTLASMGIWSGNASGDGSIFVATPGTAPFGPWPAPAIMDLPQYRLSDQGIPYYGNRDPCSLADANMIAYQFAKDGADISSQQWAVYVAAREGNCIYNTINYNLATQDDSHCTFQLNALAGMFNPDEVLGRLGWTADKVGVSMENCANAASDLWVYCGRGPWTPPYSCRPPWKDIAAAALPGG
jgi:peptidoglycan hydrolase-like protein with peptidoglycan-binding domain